MLRNYSLANYNYNVLVRAKQDSPGLFKCYRWNYKDHEYETVRFLREKGYLY